MKTLKEKIEVMQAALDGKEIEYRNYPYDNRHKWTSYDLSTIVWNWPSVDYRIKPEPMELWVNVYDEKTEELYPHKTEDAAKKAISFPEIYIKTVKFREVIE